MPYPNEHAARVRDPGIFEPTSFRSKDLKNGIRIILGKVKGGDGSMVVQTYRFSVDKFTVEQAKKWLEDNKIKYISFEPAKPMPETKEVAENKLEHVGIKGMQWGVRKKRDMPGESGGKKPKQASTEPVRLKRNMRGESGGKKLRKQSDDFKAFAELRKKKIDEMSNEELSRVIKRMDLHKRYKDLNPSKTVKGKKAVKNVFSTIGQVSAGVAGVTALAGIGSALMKKVNEHLDAKFITGIHIP